MHSLNWAGWFDLGSWARNLLVAGSTVLFNTWLALRISRNIGRREYARGYDDALQDAERYADIEADLAALKPGQDEEGTGWPSSRT